MGSKGQINRRRNAKIRRRRKIIGILTAVLSLLICISIILFISKFVLDKATEEKDVEEQTEDLTVGDKKEKERQKMEEENGEVERVKPDLSQGTADSIPICMYHYVYENSNPPEKIDANFIEVNVLEEELKYLKENGYYFPTWAEVREFIDGKIELPKKSIVLTFDDGPIYIELAVPLLEKYGIQATSFVITSYYDSKEMLDGYRNKNLYFESHSHNMHRGGGNIGHGGIFPALSKEEALQDLRQSIEYCGSGEAFAYPFGDYTVECEQVLEEAGFLCAVTTEAGKCSPGAAPYALPRVRMSGGQTLAEFIKKIQ